MKSQVFVNYVEVKGLAWSRLHSRNDQAKSARESYDYILWKSRLEPDEVNTNLFVPVSPGTDDRAVFMSDGSSLYRTAGRGKKRLRSNVSLVGMRKVSAHHGGDDKWKNPSTTGVASWYSDLEMKSEPEKFYFAFVFRYPGDVREFVCMSHAVGKWLRDAQAGPRTEELTEEVGEAEVLTDVPGTSESTAHTLTFPTGSEMSANVLLSLKNVLGAQEAYESGADDAKTRRELWNSLKDKSAGVEDSLSSDRAVGSCLRRSSGPKGQACVEADSCLLSPSCPDRKLTQESFTVWLPAECTQMCKSLAVKVQPAEYTQTCGRKKLRCPSSDRVFGSRLRRSSGSEQKTINAVLCEAHDKYELHENS